MEMRSKKKNLKVPSRGFSLYSSDSEDPVVTTHKGLDRCASLLAHIMESPLNDGDRRHEGRGKQRETTGLKTKQKKKVKKRSSKEEKSKEKVPPKVDKKVAIRAEKKNQQGRKKSKSAHHQVVFQPGLMSSTPQREVHRKEKPQQGPDKERSVQAQVIQQNCSRVRGQVPNTLGRVIQSSRFSSTGHYGDQMIPERDTSKESRHLGLELRGQNDCTKTENSKRLTFGDELGVSKQRYKPSLSGAHSTMGGYHGFSGDHFPASVESVTSTEIASLLNEPQGNMQNGLPWSNGGVAGRRQPPPESHDGKRRDNFIYPSMHERISKETQHSIHNKSVEPQPQRDCISDDFMPTSVAPADENRVARNVLRDLVNTLKNINEREATSLTTNTKVGNQAATAASTLTDGGMKRRTSESDGHTLWKEEKTDDVVRNVTEIRDQSPPVNAAGQNSKQQRSQVVDRRPEDLLREEQDSHLKADRQVPPVAKYPVNYDKKEGGEAVQDFGLERKLKGDTFPQEMKKEMTSNVQISPETCISRENCAQVEDETIPGEWERTKSPEKKKKKRKFQSASVGAKSKMKRALWEQQRVLKCLVMELKAVTEQKENLEVQRLFGEILETLDTLPYLTMDCDVQTEIAMGLQPLRSENAQLRRKLRISNQQMKELQKTEQQQQSFEVIALKTLNATLKGQLEAEQKDSTALKEQLEVLTSEMEAVGKKGEELSQLLKLKDESHLRSQREWITEMASLRRQQTCSKQELETTKSTLDSMRRENTFLLKSLEESRKMLQEFKEAQTRKSPSRKRNWEFGGLEDLPKVTREADRKTGFDVQDASEFEQTVETHEGGEESCRDVFMSSHRKKSSEKNPFLSSSTKQKPASDKTQKIHYLQEIGQYNQDRALEGEFARNYFSSEGDGNLGNLNLLSDSELEWQKTQEDRMEGMHPATSLIQTGETHVKVGSDEKQKHNEHRKEAHAASHGALPARTGLQTTTLLSDSENFGKLRGCDIPVVDDEQSYSLLPSFSPKCANMRRSLSMPLGPSEESSVPYQVVAGPYQGSTSSYQDVPGPYQGDPVSYQNVGSPYKGTLFKPPEVSKAIDQVSCVSESTASSVTSLFEAQFQLGLSNLDDKIAKLQENLKYFKDNKNT